jgi:hypothetical protein
MGDLRLDYTRHIFCWKNLPYYRLYAKHNLNQWYLQIRDKGGNPERLLYVSTRFREEWWHIMKSVEWHDRTWVGLLCDEKIFGDVSFSTIHKWLRTGFSHVMDPIDLDDFVAGEGNLG